MTVLQGGCIQIRGAREKRVTEKHQTDVEWRQALLVACQAWIGLVGSGEGPEQVSRAEG